MHCRWPVHFKGVSTQACREYVTSLASLLFLELRMRVSLLSFVTAISEPAVL